VRCSALQCVAVRCSVCCSVLQCVAVRCSVLLCVAVYCSVLQCCPYSHCRVHARVAVMGSGGSDSGGGD